MTIAESTKETNETRNDIETAHVTVITSEKPPILTKKYSLEDGKLIKGGGGQLVEGKADGVDIQSLEDLQNLISGLNRSQALCYGKPESLPANIIVDGKWKQLGRPEGYISRTNNNFSWPSGPGVFMIDYDPEGGGVPLTGDELVDLMRKSVPGFEDIDMFWIPSASSHICNTETDEDLTGLKGQRLYILVENAADIPELGENRIVEYLWAAGHGYISVTKSGAQLAKTLVDASVWQTSRLDFAAGAACSKTLEQKRGNGKIYKGRKERLNVELVQIPDETTKEKAAKAREAAKAATLEKAMKIREAWKNDRCSTLVPPNASEEEKARIESVVRKSCESGELVGAFQIVVKVDGKEQAVTVDEILSNREKYDNKECLDPLEPEYDGRRWVGILFLDGTPHLFSQSHGGCTYKLIEESPLGNEEIIRQFEKEPSTHLLQAATTPEALQSPTVEGEDIPEFIEKLNQKHAIVHTGQTYILTEKYDPELKRETFHLESVASFNTAYANKIENKVSISKQWIAHPARREFMGGIIFDPKKPGHYETYYNLFRGFVTKAKKGDCSLFWKLVLHGLCAGSEVKFTYVKRWLAHLFQKPWDKPGTAIVFRGSQGIGKDTFVEMVSALIGDHFIALCSMEQLTGRFNGHLKDALLVYANEAIWGGDKKAVGALKSMITDKLQPIEMKNKDLIQVRCYKRLLIGSNEDWVIPADLDDRRFFVVNCSDKFKENTEFFGKLRDQMANGGLQALMNDLISEDLSSWHPRTMPENLDNWDIKVRSMKSSERYIYEQLRHRRYRVSVGGTSDDDWCEESKEVEKDKIYQDYVSSCEDPSIVGKRGETETNVSFWIKVKKLIGPVETCKGKVRTNPNTGREERPPIVILPSLDEARRRFQKNTKSTEEIWDF